MYGELLIEARGVGKKFASSLKRAMLYTGRDLFLYSVGGQPRTEVLRRNEFWAVDGVDLELRRGECLGLIGANGCGKSTLLRMLNGIILPDRGRVRVRGQVGGLIQVGAGFHPLLTGRENIYISGSIRGMSKREIDAKFDEIVEFSGVGDFIDMPVKHYSSGMFVRLGYSVAAHIKPDILLMDEVLAVGDAAFKSKCLAHLQRLMSEGVTPVFVTHSMDSLCAICTRVVVMAKGRVVHDGDVDEGVGVYQQTLWNNRDEKTPALHSGDGAAAVDLEKVELLSHSDERPLATGDALHLRLTLSIREAVQPLCVSVGVESITHGILSLMDCKHDCGALQGTPGTRVLEIRIPRFHLLPGSYSLRVMIHDDHSGELLFRQLGALRLRVCDPGSASPGTGRIVDLSATWKLCS